MIKVKGDSILVKVIPDESSDKTASGLYLVHKEQQSSQLAKVIAIGDGFQREKMVLSPEGEIVKEIVKIPIDDVKEQDTVLINKYAGELVTIEDEEYLFVKHRDVLAVIEED